MLLSLASSARQTLDGSDAVLRIVTRNGDDLADSDGENGSCVILSVIGDGSPVEPNTQTRSVGPFVDAKTAGKGADTVLPNVHAIIQKAGGQISVSAESERGTTVHISLPRSAPELS